MIFLLLHQMLSNIKKLVELHATDDDVRQFFIFSCTVEFTTNMLNNTDVNESDSCLEYLSSIMNVDELTQYTKYKSLPIRNEIDVARIEFTLIFAKHCVHNILSKYMKMKSDKNKYKASIRKLLEKLQSYDQTMEIEAMIMLLQEEM